MILTLGREKLEHIEGIGWVYTLETISKEVTMDNLEDFKKCMEEMKGGNSNGRE